MEFRILKRCQLSNFSSADEPLSQNNPNCDTVCQTCEVFNDKNWGDKIFIVKVISRFSKTSIE